MGELWGNLEGKPKTGLLHERREDAGIIVSSFAKSKYYMKFSIKQDLISFKDKNSNTEMQYTLFFIRTMLIRTLRLRLPQKLRTL